MKLEIQTNTLTDVPPFINGIIYLTNNKADEGLYKSGLLGKILPLETSINLKTLGNLEDSPRFSFELLDVGITEYLENAEYSLIGSDVKIIDGSFTHAIQVYSVTKDKGVLTIECEGYQNYPEISLLTFGEFEPKKIETTISRQWAGTYRDGKKEEYFRPVGVQDIRRTTTANAYGVEVRQKGAAKLYAPWNIIVYFDTVNSSFTFYMKTPDDAPITEPIFAFVEWVDGTGKGQAIPMTITAAITYPKLGEGEGDSTSDWVVYTPGLGHLYYAYVPNEVWTTAIGYNKTIDMPLIDGSTVLRITNLSRTFTVDSDFKLEDHTFYTKSNEDGEILPISSDLITRVGNVVSITPKVNAWAETAIRPYSVSRNPQYTVPNTPDVHLQSGDLNSLTVGDSSVVFHAHKTSNPLHLKLQFKPNKGYTRYVLKFVYGSASKIDKMDFWYSPSDQYGTPLSYNPDSSPQSVGGDANTEKVYRLPNLKWVMEFTIDENDLFNDYSGIAGISLFQKYNPDDLNSVLITIESIQLLQQTKQDANLGDIYVSANTDLDQLNLPVGTVGVGGNLYQNQSLIQIWKEFGRSNLFALQQLNGIVSPYEVLNESEPVELLDIKGVSPLQDLREGYLGNQWTLTLADGREWDMSLEQPSEWLEDWSTILNKLKTSQTKYKTVQALDLAFPLLTEGEALSVCESLSDWLPLVKKATSIKVPLHSSSVLSLQLGSKVIFSHPDILKNLPIIGYIASKSANWVKDEMDLKIWTTSYITDSGIYAILANEGSIGSSNYLNDSGSDFITAV